MRGDLTREQAYLVLNGLQSVGPVGLKRLMDAFKGDPLAILNASVSALESVYRVGPAMSSSLRNWRENFDLEREEGRMQKSGVDFVSSEDQQYPALLKEMYDPPVGLYFKGKYRLSNPAIAIVGSRRMTLYGQSVAHKFGVALAKAGFCIVSGLARGIDTAAHEGALSAGGKTVAVLGCGLDIIYPPENLDLYRRISEEGAILSEFPFGRRADRQTFPMRNRIVAGLSIATVVVESALNGGAMITARFAGEQGRQLFAVPGRIDQSSSSGCHALIRDGAVLVSCVDDILEELMYLFPTLGTKNDSEETERPAVVYLEEKEKALIECFRGGNSLNSDQLASMLSFPISEVSSLLMLLELKQLIRKRMDGFFEQV
ncbi:MAG: DNA-protecting protein DprA [Opitutaceae bacterium]|nr:DNA-protecting protein DprA [Opitutaceae bacterium]